MIDIIKQMADALPLEEHYTWDVPENGPLNIPESIQGPFARNVYLKEHLRSQMENDADWTVHYWIMRDWGGIKALRPNSHLEQGIQDFFTQLPEGRLSRQSFNRISSLSKLAAFKSPDMYFIYDSRAVYSLNWLLFHHSSDRCLFPMPPGRNRQMVRYDIGTLFNASGLPHEYRPWRSAFHEYCELLKDLSQEALGDKPPYYLEMLLFVAAPEWIINDIKQRTTVMFS